MSTIHYTSCPVCGSKAIHAVFSAKDHTVSRKLFPIFECSDCSLRFTQDIPSQDEIGAFYKSEDYISHTNTSKGLVSQLYKTVRKGTLAKKQKLVQRFTALEIGNLLDVGSGTGAFASHMKNAGWEVTALEPDPDARKLGKQVFKIESNPLEDFLHFQRDNSTPLHYGMYWSMCMNCTGM